MYCTVKLPQDIIISTLGPHVYFKASYKKFYRLGMELAATHHTSSLSESYRSNNRSNNHNESYRSNNRSNNHNVNNIGVRTGVKTTINHIGVTTTTSTAARHDMYFVPGSQHDENNPPRAW